MKRRVLTDERFDLRAIEYDRQRPVIRPAPVKYGTPPVGEADPKTGDCPACGSEVELNMAGRVRPHGGCQGAGELPLLPAPPTPYWKDQGDTDAQPH